MDVPAERRDEERIREDMVWEGTDGWRVACVPKRERVRRTSRQKRGYKLGERRSQVGSSDVFLSSVTLFWDIFRVGKRKERSMRTT